jgi:IS30 family transposase
MPREQLTPAQVERIMALHRQGLSNRLIAERLGLRADDYGQNRIRRVVKRERERKEKAS